MGTLFADIRGFTAWSKKRSPTEVADGLTRFYALVSRVLTRDDALVEFIGDQVMALYLLDFPSLGARTCEVMISAAESNVGKGGRKDLTAVGDVANTAARLQSSAFAGQIVVSDEIYARAAAHCPQAEPVSLSLEGKSEPVRAYVIHAHE